MRPFSETSLNFHAVRDCKWYDWAIRFLFGGVVTAAVGVVGQAYGPVIAGLFLAFPAIAPASITLLARRHGKESAGIDALGAVLGGIGLIVFGSVVWAFGARSSAVLTLALAAIAWLLVCAGLWSLLGWPDDGADAS